MTKTQIKIIAAIEHLNKAGHPPTAAEIQNHLATPPTGKANLNRTLKQMTDKQLLTRRSVYRQKHNSTYQYDIPSQETKTLIPVDTIPPTTKQVTVNTQTDNLPQNTEGRSPEQRPPLDTILPTLKPWKGTRGRKTNLDAKLIARICGGIEKGMYQKGAAIIAGIGASTLSSYIYKGEQDKEAALLHGYTEEEGAQASVYIELLCKMARANAIAEARAIASVEEGASGKRVKCPHCKKPFEISGDWRAGIELLRVRHRKSPRRGEGGTQIQAKNLQINLQYEPLETKDR